MHKKMWVQSETIKAFKKMRRAAFWKAGIKLKIVSAYRGFDRQKTIWERKWNDSTRMALAEDSLQRAISILEYSSMPGTSRHHWGTDIDINSVENEYFETRRGKKIYKWLSENAEHFGFFQPYTAGRAKGYKEEPWHWSYRVVAEQYYTEYLNSIQCTDINGFQGCETATTLDVIEGWVKP